MINDQVRDISRHQVTTDAEKVVVQSYQHPFSPCKETSIARSWSSSALQTCLVRLKLTFIYDFTCELELLTIINFNTLLWFVSYIVINVCLLNFSNLSKHSLRLEWWCLEYVKYTFQYSKRSKCSKPNYSLWSEFSKPIRTQWENPPQQST